jgi:hypothetical protein
MSGSRLKAAVVLEPERPIIKHAVKRDQPLTWDDIDVPANRMMELWEKQKSLVGLK